MNGNQYYIKATVELLAAVFIIISTGLFIFSLWSLIGATNQTYITQQTGQLLFAIYYLIGGFIGLKIANYLNKVR